MQFKCVVCSLILVDLYKSRRPEKQKAVRPPPPLSRCSPPMPSCRVGGRKVRWQPSHQAEEEHLAGPEHRHRQEEAARKGEARSAVMHQSFT
ncbi:hypothetical protein JTE90_021938 [Oedothorax gibbosus]|uniref:Uncharacterized protein n=1 Tax=Oedothorax gibbosus TaxID=931172 RepID=A0AAV6VVY9_9ARAC|nr:hypothetical protein JTE90_021938 [Oedothorax gibbosus]